MAARTFRSKAPPSERDQGREKEKQKLSLEEHCKTMKQHMISEQLAALRKKREEEAREAEEEVMRMTYGPNWRESA